MTCFKFKTLADGGIVDYSNRIACVAGVNGEGEGEGEQGHGRKMGVWGLGKRERLLQRPPIFSFLRPPAAAKF